MAVGAKEQLSRVKSYYSGYSFWGIYKDVNPAVKGFWVLVRLVGTAFLLIAPFVFMGQDIAASYGAAATAKMPAVECKYGLHCHRLSLRTCTILHPCPRTARQHLPVVPVQTTTG